MLKRAARLAVPAAAAAATTAGVVSMTSSNGDDRQQQQQVRGVALCDDKKDESVLSMLGDIQARVSCSNVVISVVTDWLFDVQHHVNIMMSDQSPRHLI